MPYNPGITYQGGEYIARGIESAASSIGNAMVRGAEFKYDREEKAKKEKEEADYFRKLGNAMGLDEGFVASASVPQLRAEIDGFTLKRARDIVEEKKQQAEAMQRAYGMATTGGQAGPVIPLPEAMMRAGVTDPDQVRSGLTMTEAMRGNESFTPTFGEDPKTGAKWMTTSRASAVPLRDATAPGELTFFQAPDGSLVVQDARGGVKLIRAPAAGGNFVSDAERTDLIKEMGRINEELMAVAAAPADKKFGGFMGMGGVSKRERLARLNAQRVAIAQQLQLLGGAPAQQPSVEAAGASPAAGGNVIDFNDLQ